MTQSYFNYCPYTVKLAHAVTSIKQSPVLKGHLFMSYQKISYELNLSYEATCLIEASFSLSQR